MQEGLPVSLLLKKYSYMIGEVRRLIVFSWEGITHLQVNVSVIKNVNSLQTLRIQLWYRHYQAHTNTHPDTDSIQLHVPHETCQLSPYRAESSVNNSWITLRLQEKDCFKVKVLMLQKKMVASLGAIIYNFGGATRVVLTNMWCFKRPQSIFFILWFL